MRRRQMKWFAFYIELQMPVVKKFCKFEPEQNRCSIGARILILNW